MAESKPLPFYAEGLRFTCQQCHNCCRGPQPGWVYPSKKEILSIARSLGMSVDRFRKEYLVRDGDGEVSLRIQANGDCVFWNEGCAIYPVRPRQCRTYPFWAENLESAESWASVLETCHGAGRGRLYRLEEIRSVLRGRSTRP
jgi:Fe-S-cluster containining protein